MVPYSDLSGYITCGETVEINSLDARIWLEIVLEDVENYEQDSFEDYSGQLKLSFRKKCRDDENKLFSLLFEKSEIQNIRDCEKKSVNKILL